MANPSFLTIKQAADALGISARTIRRRIDDGELSATKQLRGKQEVLVIDGAEVARWGEAHGLTMTAPAAAGGKSQRQTPADTSAIDGHALQEIRLAYDKALQAQAVTIAALQAQVRDLQATQDTLLQKALPSAPAPAERRTWWQRMTGRPTAGGG